MFVASQAVNSENDQDDVVQVVNSTDYKTDWDLNGFKKFLTVEHCHNKLALKFLKNVDLKFWKNVDLKFMMKVDFVTSCKEILSDSQKEGLEEDTFSSSSLYLLLVSKTFMKNSSNYLHIRHWFSDTHVLCLICRLPFDLTVDFLEGNTKHFGFLRYCVKKLVARDDNDKAVLLDIKGFIVPYISFDLGIDRKKAALFECFVMFLQKGEFHNQKWIKLQPKGKKRKKRLAKRKKKPLLNNLLKSSSDSITDDTTDSKETHQNQPRKEKEKRSHQAKVMKENDNSSLLEGNNTRFALMMEELALKRQLEREGESAYLCITLLMCLILFSLYAMRGFHSRNAKKREMKLDDESQLLTVKEVLFKKARYLPMFNEDDGLEEIFVHDCGNDP